jgi:hypothetical protein
MRKGLLISTGFAGLVAALVTQAAVAAPTVRADVPTIVKNGRLFQEISYYYQGRHYPYRYNGKYYAHRVYRHDHWRYY